MQRLFGLEQNGRVIGFDQGWPHQAMTGAQGSVIVDRSCLEAASEIDLPSVSDRTLGILWPEFLPHPLILADTPMPFDFKGAGLDPCLMIGGAGAILSVVALLERT